jgi:hypothetical protein
MQLLLRPFYVFPCGHRFHSDCFIAALTSMLSIERQTQLADLQYQLTQASGRPDELPTMNQQQHVVNTDGGSSASLSTKEQIKTDIDELVASECLYCGELMIE